MKKKNFLFVIFAVIFVSSLSFPAVSSPAQTEETESSVPELSAFHDVIYPIWHTAYPEKDYDALRKFVPEINRLAENLYKASLPGILRDKSARWEEGLSELKKAVKDYNLAASGDDDEALLNAAEELHSKYEMMVRIIRPVLKEVDEFHKVLYIVYHKYLPEMEFDKIAEASQDLVLKAEAITQAQLPQRLAAKTEPFETAAKELVEASKALKEQCETQDPEVIVKAVEALHTKYQNLEKIFE